MEVINSNMSHESEAHGARHMELDVRLHISHRHQAMEAMGKGTEKARLMDRRHIFENDLYLQLLI